MAMDNFNQRIIDEFRAKGGKVGAPFEGAPVLLLHHTGAKSGIERVNPLVYMLDGDRYLVFASKGGFPSNPDWYHNLKANPDTSIEVGVENYDVRAEEIKGEERDRLFAKQAELFPQFAQYQERTDRTIPVVALTRRS